MSYDLHLVSLSNIPDYIRCAQGIRRDWDCFKVGGQSQEASAFSEVQSLPDSVNTSGE